MNIDKHNVEDILGLSPIQEGMLYHYISNDIENCYIQQLALKLLGDICIESLKKAWEFVIESNEMLRTVFRWKKLSSPIQIVLRHSNGNILTYDLSKLSIEDSNSKLYEIKESVRILKLDIETNPLRIIIIKINEKECEMFICWHHIIFDGWSNGIILKEFFNVYNNIRSGENLIKPLKSKYKDFIKWINSEDKKNHKKFWESYLKNFGERTNLPYDYIGIEKENHMKNLISKLDCVQTQRLNDYTRKNEVTLASVIYCAWGILLQKYNNSNDVIFGTTVSGRVSHIKSIEEIVGLFINTIPLRVQSEKEEKISKLVKKVNTDLKIRKEYENTPLVDITSYRGMKSNETIFNSIIVLENYPIDESIKNSKHINIDSYSMDETTNYDITLGITILDTLEFDFSYNSGKFNTNTIKRIEQHFINVLMQIISSDEINISKVEIYTNEEFRQILLKFNKPIVLDNQNEVLHNLFEKQVLLTPNNIAVIHDSKRYTFNEINEKANILARLLIKKGLQPEDTVAIVLERSVYLIISMLAVMKAGGVYIPIDYEYSSLRLDFIIKDANVKAILTQTEFISDILFQGSIIQVNDQNIYYGDNTNLSLHSLSRSLAYIIYTSGSTGNPKGVMIEHRNVINYVKAFQTEFNIIEKDVVLQQAPCSFDHSVEEIYPPLLNGAAIVIANKMDVLDINKLVGLINENNISIITVQPLLLNELNKLPVLNSVHTFLSGADVLKPAYFSNLVKYARVYNTYGPTEGTVCASYFNCSSEKNIKTVLIGKPIYNYKIYILNKENMLMPIGIPGEICISGEGVARGYVNNKKLTNEKFIQDPFESNNKIYKTGDRGKWLEDGNIEFLGRVDEQVKIRGFRIELGEIEFHLKTHHAIADAVVLPVESPSGIKCLAAYIQSSGDIKTDDLRQHVAMKLPDYMVPTYFYKIDKIPRTNNSKTDIKALIDCKDSFNIEEKIDKPISITEQKIMAIWKDILQVNDISINNNFFDIGGNSILLMQMHSRIEKEYSVDIKIADLFTHTTISKISKFIDGKGKKIDQSIFNGFQILPASYFEKNMLLSGIGTINFSIENYLFKKLQQISKYNQVELQDLFIGMYFYLLTEISEEKIGTIQYLKEKQMDVIPIKIDLNIINGFNDLFKFINENRRLERNVQLYTLEQALNLVFKKEEHLILPLISRNFDFSFDSKLLETFDIVLIINENLDNKNVDFICKYNNKHLNKVKINYLMKAFIKLIKQLVNAFKEEEKKDENN